MNYDHIRNAAAALHLTPLGGVHENDKTIVLLGPDEPGFWAYVSTQPDFLAGGSDPLDHWSRAAIGPLAKELGAQPVFPFGGPPHHPFISWALRSGVAWQSPVGLLVHRVAGLFVSYRGALVFDGRLDLPPAAENPCQTCSDQPCAGACPVQALGAGGYDVPGCKAHMDVDPGCRAACAVRLACPVSRSYGRDPAQTAFHMEAFHPS